LSAISMYLLYFMCTAGCSPLTSGPQCEVLPAFSSLDSVPSDMSLDLVMLFEELLADFESFWPTSLSFATCCWFDFRCESKKTPTTAITSPKGKKKYDMLMPLMQMENDPRLQSAKPSKQET